MKPKPIIVNTIVVLNGWTPSDILLRIIVSYTIYAIAQKIVNPIDNLIQLINKFIKKKGVAIRNPIIKIRPDKNILKKLPIIDQMERFTRFGAFD